MIWVLINIIACVLFWLKNIYLFFQNSSPHYILFFFTLTLMHLPEFLKESSNTKLQIKYGGSTKRHHFKRHHRKRHHPKGTKKIGTNKKAPVKKAKVIILYLFCHLWGFLYLVPFLLVPF